MAVKVGKPAPDFETKGYINGEIKTVKLSDISLAIGIKKILGKESTS